MIKRLAHMEPVNISFLIHVYHTSVIDYTDPVCRHTAMQPSNVSGGWKRYWTRWESARNSWQPLTHKSTCAVSEVRLKQSVLQPMVLDWNAISYWITSIYSNHSNLNWSDLQRPICPKCIDISCFPHWSVSVESWCNCKESIFPRFSHIFLLFLFHPPFLGTTPQVFLFSLLRWAVTPQLLSLYCFSMPRSLHKALKGHLKGELKLQLSIRLLEQLHVTVTLCALFVT